MLNRLNIKTKIFLILIVTIIAVVIFTFIFFHTVEKLEKYSSIEVNVEKLKSSMLMLRRHEKDFLLRNKLLYKDEFLQEYQHSLILASTLSEQLKSNNYRGDEIGQYLSNLNIYKTAFIKLIKAMNERGLDEKSGLYGSLRSAIHKVQNYATEHNYTLLLAKVYELRKNEKDFMLRKKLKYVKEFLQNFKNLSSLKVDKSMKNYLLEYKQEFLSLVEKETLCGLDENSGLQGEMRQNVHITEHLLKVLEKNITGFEKNHEKNMFTQIYLSAFVAILIILFLIITISNNILDSLRIFQKGLLDFFDYLNKKREDILTIKIDKKDEFAQMAELINKQIAQTADFMKEEETKLKGFAEFDELTGIYNRRKLNDFLIYHINEFKRYKKEFSLIFIDLDDFKKVNDTYGHAGGDIILQKFVQITKDNIRDVDIFARWGGEEFILLLPNTDIDNAYIVSEKIRKAIENYHNTLIGSFTVSLGVSSIRSNDTLESLIKKADKALYRAKNEGKNKTVVYKEQN